MVEQSAHARPPVTCSAVAADLALVVASRRPADRVKLGDGSGGGADLKNAGAVCGIGRFGVRPYPLRIAVPADRPSTNELKQPIATRGPACDAAQRGRQVMDSWRNRKTLILSRTDMMGLLTPAEYNACVEQAYRMHGEKRFYMDPKGHIVLDKYPGEWEAMPSYIEEPEAAACKWVSIPNAIARHTICPRCSRSSSTRTRRPVFHSPSAMAATTR
jgi:hypothetical protein